MYEQLTLPLDFDMIEENTTEREIMIDTGDLTYLGSFTVDSGQAMIGDPCYLDEWEPWNAEVDNFEEHETKAGEYGYLGACGITLKEGYGVLGNGSAVAFTTGWGDGVYPVFAKLNDEGRIAAVVIEFIGDEE